MSVAVLPATVASANPDVVTNCSGSPSVPGSLPYEVAAANPGDTVTFALSPPCSTITLASTITISQDLTITGPGSGALAVSGNNAVGIFSVNSGVTATISGLTLQDGSTGSDGGAINNSGTLTVSNSTLSNNTAFEGGGIYSDGTVTLTNSTVADNTGTSDGAGIVTIFTSTLTITDSTISGNTASSGTGGIESIRSGSLSGTVTITDSTVSDNTGGGISNQGAMTITGSTISNNDIPNSDPGGGIVNQSGFEPAYMATLGLSNSTVADNSAGYGGGVFNVDAATITNSTVAGNVATGIQGGGGIYTFPGGTTTIGATILSGSAASGGECNGIGTISDDGYNLADDASCSLGGTGDLSSTPAGLDASGLQDNGGPTQTIALDPGSAAIGHVGNPSQCPATDQRGYPRKNPCDIGAYDSAGSLITPCTTGATGCTATTTVSSQTVAVTGTKTSGATASINLSVAPQVLACQGFSYLAPVATLTDTGLKAGTDVVVTDTVKSLPSKKGVVICYEPVQALPPPAALLPKCHGKTFTHACYQSVNEVAGSVVATLELPAGDPRFHIGGETPSIASYSPAAAKPGKKLTIKGGNLSEITGVTIGGVAATIIKTAPASVSVTVPASSKGGVVRVTSLAGSVVGPAIGVLGARLPLHSSPRTADAHHKRP
jgi:predicted outer membrane repeat protein